MTETTISTKKSSVNKGRGEVGNLIYKIALWVAIGSLVGGALISVALILLGDNDRIVSRALWTVFLLAGFSGVILLEFRVTKIVNPIEQLVSVAGWMVVLFAGAFKIWTPFAVTGTGGYYYEGTEVAERVWFFLLILVIVRLACLHFSLYSRRIFVNPTMFKTITGWFTVALTSVLTIMLVIPLTNGNPEEYDDFYWRVVVAMAVLVAVGTALLPLVTALTTPRVTQPSNLSAVVQPVPVTPEWPRFADGITPLPILPDNTPDWGAQTGAVNPASRATVVWG